MTQTDPNPAASPASAPEAPTLSPEARALAQRHNGITPERQRIFVEVLAATGSVSEAARQAGATRQAFYAHRMRDGGRDFARAWDLALSLATQRLCDVAYERAIEGVEEPVFYHGELVGTRRRYNDRLLMYLLRVRGAADGYAPLPDLRGGWTTVQSFAPPSLDATIADLGAGEVAEGGAGRRRRRRGAKRVVEGEAAEARASGDGASGDRASGDRASEDRVSLAEPLGAEAPEARRVSISSTDGEGGTLFPPASVGAAEGSGNAR